MSAAFMTGVLAWAALIATTVLAVVLARRSRSVAVAVVAAALIFHYHVDAVATIARGRLYFSRTYPDLVLSLPALTTTVVLATAVLGLWSLGYVVVRQRGGARPVGPVAHRVRLWVGAVVLVPVALVAQRMAAGGVGELLVANRQQVLSSDLFGMVVFHVVPAAAALAFYGAATERGRRRAAWAALFLVYFGLAIVSGSRSSFFLNVLAPVGAYVVARWLRRRPAPARWPAGRTIGAAVLLAVVAVAGFTASTTYRDATRGEQRPDSMFASPDLTQLDATALIVGADLGPTPTYPAAAVAAVPRALWPEKPLSGNASLSAALFAERYETSRSEVTASLLGEAWLNARWLGAVVAAVLLLALVLVAERLLATPGVAAMVGYVVLFRGVNLIRSDLLNTLVPLVFVLVLFWVAARPAARVSPVRTVAPAWVGGAG